MKYVAFYDTRQYAAENRVIALSCAELVAYTGEMLGEIEDTEIISPARTKNRGGVCRPRRVRLGEHVTCRVPPSFGVRTKTGKALLNVFTQLWLLLSLLAVPKNEYVVVYHSLYTMFAVKVARKLRQIDLILEIREIYSDARGGGAEKRSRELRYFACADKYIFATRQLNAIINTSGKPFAIMPGLCRAETPQAEKFSDGKIHAVYAGTLDARKGGAYAAILSARWLPASYHIHILGNDLPENVRQIMSAVREVSAQAQAEVTYDGALYGDEFKRFLQRCHVGLSTQDPDGAYNLTSFPSKILTYLSNGLPVLSARIPAVEQCAVGGCIHYYDRQSPRAIAQALCKMGAERPDDGLLRAIDQRLRRELRALICENTERGKP